MKTIDQDVRFLQVISSELKDFLFSKEIYWPVNGLGGISQYSLGTILLSIRRLKAACLMKQSYENPLQPILETQHRWQANWSKKATLEYPSRFHLWKSFLIDFLGSPFDFSDQYRREVGNRVILHLLGEERYPIIEDNTLCELDQRLSVIGNSGSFLWETELEVGFPRKEFWYLYPESIKKEGL